MEMMEADPIDVLLALIKVEESIQAWKAAVVDLVRERAETMHIALGPFRPGDGPQPPQPEPPYTGCWPEISFMGVYPRSGCHDFDIDTQVDQISGFLMGLHHGLLHDRDAMNP